MNNNFRNFLFKKLTVNDPSINIILNVERLYNEKIKQKKNHLNLKIRSTQNVRRLNQFNTEKKSFSIFEGFGLTFEEEKRFYIIQAIKKYYNLFQQLLDFYNQESTYENRMRQVNIFKSKINQELRRKRKNPLPRPEEWRQVEGNNEVTKQLKNKKFAYHKFEFLNKLRNQDYPLFLNLKRGHLEYNVKKYSLFDLFPRIENKNRINLELKENIDFLSNNHDIFIKFGINKLVFDEEQLEKDNLTKETIIENLIYWIKEVFIPLKLNMDNYKDQELYLSYNDIVLFNIQFCLLYLKNEVHSREGSIEMTRGAWGAPFSIGEHVFKHEHLRHNESSNFSKRRLYPKYNYQMSVYFIGYIIQNYSNYYFENIVPRTYKITYNLNKNIAETNMNKANINKAGYLSCNLNQFLRKPSIYKRTDLLDLFKRILKKICIILIPMQKNLGFVHRDFHPGNIIIIYKYINHNGNNINISENNIPKNDLQIDFDLKLIDFTFSSILIKDENEKINLFKYTNWQVYRLPYLLNPYETNFWKCYDLIFFILRIIFNTTLILNNKYNHNLYNQFNLLISYIIELFNFQTDFNIKFKEIFTDARRVNIYSLLQNKELFIDILGHHVNLNFFDPSILINEL